MLEEVVGLTGDQVHDISIDTFERYAAARPAPETFAGGCGSVWDKTALALALCREAGLTVEPCLRAASPDPQRAIPALVQFDRVLLRTSPGGAATAIYADPQSGSFYRDAQEWGGTPLLAIGVGRAGGAGVGASVGAAAGADADADGRGGQAWIGLDNPAERSGSALIEIGLALDAEGAVTGDAVFTLSGALCPVAELRDPRGFAGGYAGRFGSEPEVTELAVTRLSGKEAELRCAWKAAALGEESAGRRYLQLPGAPRSVADLAAAHELDRPQRSTDLLLPGRLHERIRYRVHLPAVAEVSFVPHDESVQTGVGNCRIASRLEEVPPRNGEEACRILEITREISVDRAEIPSASYGEFRRLLQVWRSDAGRMVVLSWSK
jgi:hypothetical protein